MRNGIYYSRKIANVIRDYLQEDAWTYSFYSRIGIFVVRLNICEQLQNICCIIDVREKEVLFYSGPIVANIQDPEMMARAAEYICRINNNIDCGAFEMDYNNGKIRYKSYLDCREDSIPTKAVVSNSIHSVFELYKKYEAGFIAVISENCSAKEAYDQAERSFEDRLVILEELLSAFDDAEDEAETKTEALKTSAPADSEEPGTDA